MHCGYNYERFAHAQEIYSSQLHRIITYPSRHLSYDIRGDWDNYERVYFHTQGYTIHSIPKLRKHPSSDSPFAELRPDKLSGGATHNSVDLRATLNELACNVYHTVHSDRARQAESYSNNLSNNLQVPGLRAPYLIYGWNSTSLRKLPPELGRTSENLCLMF